MGADNPPNLPRVSTPMEPADTGKLDTLENPLPSLSPWARPQKCSDAKGCQGQSLRVSKP
jgi:hypothetical protein